VIAVPPKEFKISGNTSWYMVGTGTNKAVIVPNAGVLAGGGKLNVTTRREGTDSVDTAGVYDVTALSVELYEADEAKEPKNNVY
jgi:hypothetical protein